MHTMQQDSALLQFSTSQLRPADRLPAVRDLFDRSVQLQLDAEPGQSVEMEMLLTPGLRRARMLSPFTARLARPKPMLADGEDTVCLMMKASGHLAVAQGRCEGTPELGDGVLLVYREPALLQFAECTYVSVRVPYSAVAPLTRDTAAAAGGIIRRDVEALNLLRDYISNLPSRFADPRLGQLSASHVYDLVALAIGATADAGDAARHHGVKAARLEAIKSDVILRGVGSVDLAAKRQQISPRYVQVLFEESGTTFSEFVLGHRLDVAHRMLRSPRYSAWSVIEIALEAGFNDVSYFNKRFKRRYALTPSDVRRRE